MESAKSSSSSNWITSSTCTREHHGQHTQASTGIMGKPRHTYLSLSALETDGGWRRYAEKRNASRMVAVCSCVSCCST